MPSPLEGPIVFPVPGLLMLDEQIDRKKAENETMPAILRLLLLSI